MNIEITWDDEAKTIIRYTFQPGWTLTEFHEVYHEARKMIQESPNRVSGIIVDDSRHAMPPKDALMAFRRTVKEGTLPIVIVSIGHTGRILMKVVESAFQKERPIFYVETLDAARTLLQDLAAKDSTEE